jgi:Zn-dependent M32 family carboxypeptidase
MIIDNATLPQVITPEMKQGIQNALKEMSGSKTRAEAEKTLQKEIADRMKEEFGIPKSEFNKLARIYHEASLIQEAQKNEEFMIFAEQVLSNGLEYKE